MFILQLLLLVLGCIILFYGIKGYNKADYVNDYIDHYGVSRKLIITGSGCIFMAIVFIINHFT